jgi:hypothetical protein
MVDSFSLKIHFIDFTSCFITSNRYFYKLGHYKNKWKMSIEKLCDNDGTINAVIIAFENEETHYELQLRLFT